MIFNDYLQKIDKNTQNNFEKREKISQKPLKTTENGVKIRKKLLKTDFENILLNYR